MATKQSTVEFLLDQFSDAGDVSAKKMFGEYGVFLQGKMFALICDDSLFLKPTDPGRALISNPIEVPPYPGAKPCFLVPEDEWDNRDFLSALAKATADAIPLPRKKAKKP